LSFATVYAYAPGSLLIMSLNSMILGALAMSIQMKVPNPKWKLENTKG